MDVEQTAVIIRDAIRDIPKQFDDNKTRITEIENEIMDVEHYLEFCRFNAFEGWEYANQIKELRIERRKLKDENDELRHVVGLMQEMKKKAVQFDNAIGNIRKSKGNRIKRSYRCRVRLDLQNKINGVRK